MCVPVWLFKPTYIIKEKASCFEMSISYDKVETEQDNMYVILSINIISIKWGSFLLFLALQKRVFFESN